MTQAHVEHAKTDFCCILMPAGIFSQQQCSMVCSQGMRMAALGAWRTSSLALLPWPAGATPTACKCPSCCTQLHDNIRSAKECIPSRGCSQRQPQVLHSASSRVFTLRCMSASCFRTYHRHVKDLPHPLSYSTACWVSCFAWQCTDVTQHS